MLEPTTLQIVWFVLIGLLWTGYLVLEGFDYGVAMLVPFLSRNEKERRTMINTIGPVWDGNEVWLLTAGGATFAAFPAWYATLFSGLYLPLFLILLGLIVRGVSFEYRAQRPATKWRHTFDWLSAGGSFVVALVFGVGFANFVIGLPVTVAPTALSQANYMLTPNPYFFQLFSPFALLGGVTLVVLFLFHGSIYLTLKTRGEIHDRALGFSRRVGLVAIIAGAVFLLAQHIFWPGTSPVLGWLTLVVAAAGLIVAWYFVGGRLAGAKAQHADVVVRPGYSFIATSVATAAIVVGIFLRMFPGLGFVDAANPAAIVGGPTGLNIVGAASTEGTLTTMLIVAVITVPIILAYTIWVYWVVRKPLSVDNIPGEGELPIVPNAA
ncbi:MAG: cytochrome d ubiquinol oxidase subunit II [Propionibacteriaceae bacterium]|jgi:cytochrome d ubiquinol oxidase subunit II|nr:cytochrome d ubiquinol oxidase subunit II [Propionibacteriaceae bacterium]